MPDDLDIYRTASVLIWEHGENAALEAALLADHMLNVGDMGALAVWWRVLKAIKAIQSKRLCEGEPLNPPLPRHAEFMPIAWDRKVGETQDLSALV